MNRTNCNEESSLVGNAAPMSANSRYVIEDLVTNSLENAPQMLDTPTSNRSGLVTQSSSRPTRRWPRQAAGATGRRRGGLPVAAALMAWGNHLVLLPVSGLQ